MRSLEIRRHAKRDPQADRLSAEGRVEAEDLGRTLAGTYAVVFVSPAQRAAETAAWILRGMGQQLPAHDVVDGLAGRDPDDGQEAMARCVRELLARVPDGGRGLAVGHTPLIERAAEGLGGLRIEPLGECEGILVTEEQGRVGLTELRLGRDDGPHATGRPSGGAG
jgi:phosphohistidine phosphatase SixA